MGVEVCNAGHCSPLVLREHGVERLCSNGLPLGIFPDCQYTTTHCALRPEESLVLYSDGVTEAADSSNEEFGDQRLIDSLRKTCLNGAAAMADGVLKDLGLFRKGSQFADDVTLLVLCRTALMAS
jgi:serine phosphatase RsbU (regulator of sigma subunit)